LAIDRLATGPDNLSEKITMSTAGQKAAVIIGAPRGIGAGLTQAYRKLGYAVVATSRTIAPSADFPVDH
jgi:NAD(P)-dependent dehydrogenase (short-subunit alcohol dehydrogenase family)